MQIPESTWLRTIDVSQFNNGGKPIPWDTVVPELPKLGIGRVLVRASYGPGYEDPQFAYNWAALKRLGVPKGAYHAGVPGASPNLDAHAQQQSAFFLDVVNKAGGIQGDDWPILDFEDLGGLTPDQMTLWASHWLACVDAAVRNSKNPAIFYSYPAFIAAHMGLYDTLASRPLWLADYPGGTALPTFAPPNVGAWTSYFGWQYTDALTIPGITGAVDGSVFAVVVPPPAPATPPVDVTALEAQVADLTQANQTLTTKITHAQQALQ